MSDLYHRKGLGQVFLVSQHWIHKIVHAVGIEPGDYVIEIGPGKGALTKELIASVQDLDPRPNLLLIEKDPEMVRGLSNWLPEWIHIKNKDLLDVETSVFDHNCKIVSNLPYSASTAILIRLLRLHNRINRMV